MTLTVALVVLVSAGLAFANGSNDVSKGVATLVGSGVTGYRRALVWGAVWTGAGGVLGALFAGAMLVTFGSGLLTAGTSATLPAALAALAGAAGWVIVATRGGLPVSTTHAIVGSLVGVAMSAHGAAAVQWGVLGGKIVVPLLLAPLVALLLSGVIARAMRARAASGGAAADCLCAAIDDSGIVAVAGPAPASALAVAPATLRVTAASTGECAAERPQALRVTVAHLHWLASGATSLARGMNDAPKIVALALSASALGATVAVPTAVLFTVVTVAMVAGSLIAGLRVTRVLAEEVTPMNDREGLAAGVVTAALVTAGAMHGLPMSTTHVASGGIFGAGAQRDTLDRRALHNIVLAWIVTLPAAAALGAGSYALAALFWR